MARDQVALGEGPQKWTVALFQLRWSPVFTPQACSTLGVHWPAFEGLAHGEVLGTSLPSWSLFPHL